MEDINIRSLLEIVEKESLRTHYIKEAQTPEKLKEALGVAIAVYCDWCGIPILEVFMGALEDANYHRLANHVSDWIETMKGVK